MEIIFQNHLRRWPASLPLPQPPCDQSPAFSFRHLWPRWHGNYCFALHSSFTSSKDYRRTIYHCVTRVHVAMTLPEKCMHCCNDPRFCTFIQPSNGGHDPTLVLVFMIPSPNNVFDPHSQPQKFTTGSVYASIHCQRKSTAFVPH